MDVGMKKVHADSIQVTHLSCFSDTSSQPICLKIFKLQKLSASSLHHPGAVCLQIKQLTVSYQVITALNKQSSASPAHFLKTCIVLALTRIHRPVHTLILFSSYKPVQLVVPVHSKSITKQKRVNQTSWMQRVELTRPGAPFMIRKKFKTTIIEHENLLLS